jgi:hypothetical protein
MYRMIVIPKVWSRPHVPYWQSHKKETQRPPNKAGQAL